MKNLDIIWNISLVCPWDCEFCCTDAAFVRKKGGNIIVSDQNFGRMDVISDDLRKIFLDRYPNIKPTIYDIALIERQAQGRELTLSQKFKVLENLRGFNVKLDLAGGDPLACYENLYVIRRAAEIFGKENISITSTGHSIGRYCINELSELIGMYEFTYDEFHTGSPSERPRGYNSLNMKAAELFSNRGVKTKAQLPLHPGNIPKYQIDNIYKTLMSSGIDELLIMRTFPVGRGREYLKRVSISKDDIVAAISHYKEIQVKDGPLVRLQCALKHLYPSDDYKNPCDLMHKSFGVNFQGLLLLSAWANGEKGYPLDESFVLGDLTKATFSEISNTERFKSYEKKLDENYGHCKIFSFLNASDGGDGIFQRTDPLYLT